MYSLSCIQYSPPSRDAPSAFKPTGKKQVAALGTEAFITLIVGGVSILLLLHGNYRIAVFAFSTEALVFIDYMIGTAIKAVKNHQAAKATEEIKNLSNPFPSEKIETFPSKKIENTTILVKDDTPPPSDPPSDPPSEGLVTHNQTIESNTIVLTSNLPPEDTDQNQIDNLDLNRKLKILNDLQESQKKSPTQVETNPGSVSIQAESEKEKLLRQKGELEKTCQDLQLDIAQYSNNIAYQKSFIQNYKATTLISIKTKLKLDIEKLENEEFKNNLINQSLTSAQREEPDSEKRKMAEEEIITNYKESVAQRLRSTENNITVEEIGVQKLEKSRDDARNTLEALNKQLQDVKQKLEQIS